MDVLALAAVAALAALTILFVARPFRRSVARVIGPPLAPEPPKREISGLLEERDRALAALRELDFDLQAGTISPADHGRLIGPLRKDAAQVLRRLAEVQTSGRAVVAATPITACRPPAAVRARSAGGAREPHLGPRDERG